MKNELGGKVMEEFVGLRAKTIQLFKRKQRSKKKKEKGTKKCVRKIKLKLQENKEMFKNCST